MTGLNFKEKKLTLKYPLIMGILNVTPDSFSDGGQFENLEIALEKSQAMIAEGADIIDIGGESTRPGAESVSEQQEIDRVLPVIEALKSVGCPLSVDTRKPKVMEQAIAAGADMVNDITALQSIEAKKIVADAGVLVCLMHMQGTPQTMQSEPSYKNVAVDVIQFLLESASNAEAFGVKKENIILDPGFGFGKTLGHNIALFQSLNKLVEKGYPVLAGLSRKSMLGEITGKNSHNRMPASISSGLLALQSGVNILRVHDVAETADMLKIFKALT